MITVDVDLKKAILWQYQEAVSLIGLVEVMQHGYDVTHKNFWEKWFNDVFNVDTATTFGLHLWMRILGIDPLQINGEPPERESAWGFRRNFRPHINFAPMPLYTYRAYRNIKRDLIKLRYFSLTMPISLDALVECVDKVIAPRGNFTLTEWPMKIQLHLDPPTTPEQQKHYDIITQNTHLYSLTFPRPAGVDFFFTWD
jgi:hypothetical protein